MGKKAEIGVDYIPVRFLRHKARLIVREDGRVQANYWNFCPRETIAYFNNSTAHGKIIYPYNQEHFEICRKWVARMRLIYPNFDCSIDRILTKDELE